MCVRVTWNELPNYTVCAIFGNKSRCCVSVKLGINNQVARLMLYLATSLENIFPGNFKLHRLCSFFSLILIMHWPCDILTVKSQYHNNKNSVIEYLQYEYVQLFLQLVPGYPPSHRMHQTPGTNQPTALHNNMPRKRMTPLSYPPPPSKSSRK